MNKIAYMLHCAISMASQSHKEPNFSFLPEQAATGMFPKRRKMHKINARKQSR